MSCGAFVAFFAVSLVLVNVGTSAIAFTDRPPHIPPGEAVGWIAIVAIRPVCLSILSCWIFGWRFSRLVRVDAGYMIRMNPAVPVTAGLVCAVLPALAWPMWEFTKPYGVQIVVACLSILVPLVLANRILNSYSRGTGSAKADEPEMDSR